MALRLAMLKCTAHSNDGCVLGIRTLAHAAVTPLPLDWSLESSIATSQLALPEFDVDQVIGNNNDRFRFGFSGFSFSDSMELMAVPKKKVTPHKRGLRNGPKALKPTPVIILCRSCGRVKLPHFYCCSGDRGKNGERK